MDLPRFEQITSAYPRLRIALIGDFCLDRYLEIDPAREEISIETGRPVHNVVNVRAQPGAAGTILNNLVALGIGEISAVGFCGEDGEGWELIRALNQKPGVRLDHFIQTPDRHTFTYTKPLLISPGKPPKELDRLDFKNWTPTPASLAERMVEAARRLAPHADAFILLDQVDAPGTGVVTDPVLAVIAEIARNRPGLPILADSRRSLRGYPAVDFKMNAAELARFFDETATLAPEALSRRAAELARQNRRHCFITLSEAGIIGATPQGEVHHLPAFPVRGEIDVVGAGDAVTANLAAALSAGATLVEALELAMAGASVVLHQLGTTGTATPAQLRERLQDSRS